MLAAPPAHGEAPGQRFDIPAEDASAALSLFARQAGRQLLYPYDAVVGRRTPALHGTYPVLEAAERLARATGLAVRSANGDTITLGPAKPAPTLAEAARTTPRPRAPVTATRPVDPERVLTPPGLLQPVIVTATRQSELLNRVPLSLTALTRQTLDEQNVRQASDMQAGVPALVLSQLTPGLANVAIRGVSDSGSGAATTGFYLDDTPIQKRSVSATRNGSGNGTPLPPLFDLQRVEVLRGPQGTLFGAGSEGGTIRYISTPPSLTAYSLYAKAEVSGTAGGDPSAEAGVAIGGPIVRDRLGFRLSVYDRRSGGFLDYIDPITNTLRFKNANSGDAKMLRAAVTLQATERLSATLQLTSSNDRWASATAAYTPTMASPIVVPTLCFDTTGVTPAHPQSSPVPVRCGSPGVTYVRPGFTYGPYPNVGPGKTLARDRTPSSTNIFVPTLTLAYDGGGLNLRAITSYVGDKTRYVGIDNLSQIRDSPAYATFGSVYIPRGVTVAGDYPDAWQANGHFQAMNKRRSLTEELRLSSAGEARPLSWTAGVFYSNTSGRQEFDNVYEGLDRLAQTLFGITAEQRYGAPAYVVNGVQDGFDHKDQGYRDTEAAAFGELNYWLTERLKAIAGVRASRLVSKYTEHHYGPASGFDTPTVANGGGPNSGQTVETPVAPKLGLEYQLGRDDIVYLTAAEGFRAGGVNANLPSAICGAGLAQYGLTSRDVPPTYRSDRVWSYEAGGKFRLAGDRLQLNAAFYRIDWQDAQLTVDVGNSCGIPFTSNAGKVRSQGVDVEAQARLSPALTADLALGFDDGRYTEDAVAVQNAATPLLIARKGQRLAGPPLTLRLGGRYDFAVLGRSAYLRADWYYTGGYDDAAPQTFGLPSYAPDALYPATARVNVRLGMTARGVDLALFATNLLNSSAGARTGGRNGCALASAGGGPDCTSYGAYNPFFVVTPAAWPREVGLQLTYRR